MSFYNYFIIVFEILLKVYCWIYWQASMATKINFNGNLNYNQVIYMCLSMLDSTSI